MLIVERSVCEPHREMGPGGFVYMILVAILAAVILLWLERLNSGNRGHLL